MKYKKESMHLSLRTTTVVLLGILFSAVVLSGCSGPKPTDTQILQLGQPTATSEDARAKQTNPPKGSSTDLLDAKGKISDLSDQNGINTQPTGESPMMGQTEKTLADFKTIEASSVTLSTTKGDITFEIYTDKVPLTAQNFLNLASEGFYDGIVFHRVIENFMAQAGDPLSKDPSKKAQWGTGGPGYVIADEFVDELKHDSAGIVSMANKGIPTTGGSQFFITFEPTPWLDGKHTVFGKVTAGLDVLMTITQGDVITSVSYK